MLLSEIGTTGQKRLADATAVVIGVGALGCTAAGNLARMGVGNIKVVDRDRIELNNLHRQILFDARDIDQPKAVVAAKRLKAINPDIKITPILKDVNFSNIELIIKDATVVVDGTDNMETRFLINDVCVKHDIPWVYGGAIGTYGMTFTIIPHKTPCFRCFMHNIPAAGALPTCDTVGVLNAIPIIIGAIESVEALKIIIGNNELNRSLLMYDVWKHDFQSVQILKNNQCKCCVEHDFEFLHVKKRAIVTALCGRNTVQITPIQRGEISLRELYNKLQRLGDVKLTKFTVIFKLPNYELTIFKDGRAMIHGTADENLAKSLYAKYVGA
jgi:adenylyltransferase/sulfurtransferase